MINEKLIEIINDLKTKKISDIEITDILLLNNYNIDEIKENLKNYNDTHGYNNYNYIDKYEKIQGKKFFDNTQKPEEIKDKNVKEKPVKNNKIKEPKKEKKEPIKINVTGKPKKKVKIADFIGLLLIIMLVAFIVYVFLNYDVISKIKAFI
jgi:hypothetical protein